MRVADRVSDVADRMQTRRLESKRDTLDRDNDRLRTELRTIKQELDRERSARDELIDALKKGEGTVKADKVKVKTKKRGGLLRMLIIGGGAYVLGTRAGRVRYEQIKDKAQEVWELPVVQTQAAKVSKLAKSSALAVPRVAWNGAIKVVKAATTPGTPGQRLDAALDETGEAVDDVKGATGKAEG